MYSLIIVLVILASLLMVGIVLIQESKGGGLASSFASSNQIMGVRKTTDILEKTTWTLIASIAILSIITAYVSKPKDINSGSVLEDSAIENQYTNPESATTTFDSPIEEIQDLPVEE